MANPAPTPTCRSRRSRHPRSRAGRTFSNCRTPRWKWSSSPCAGRIVRISYKGGDNILRLDAGLKDRVPDGGRGELWMNYGGDWIWPVAQSRWTSIAKSDWPPPTPLAEKPWTGTAWKDADGTSVLSAEPRVWRADPHQSQPTDQTRQGGCAVFDPPEDRANGAIRTAGCPLEHQPDRRRKPGRHPAGTGLEVREGCQGAALCHAG